jgi:tRNA threonylcarbamoyladenosine biosynthesis protein TsaB
MSDSAIILAIDTTSEFGSLAVRRGGETVWEVHLLHATDGFGPRIIGAIAEVLAKANAKLREIDCFAAANGPGSFTGVRVGLASIKGMAEALHKPAVGISNLRALSLFGKAPLRAVALDARRGQVYGAVYDSNARIVVAETVTSWDEWVSTIPPGAEFIGLEDGPCKNADVVFTTAPLWLAAAVAECAELDRHDGWTDPVAIDANYVRRADADLSWKDK